MCADIALTEPASLPLISVSPSTSTSLASLTKAVSERFTRIALFAAQISVDGFGVGIRGSDANCASPTAFLRGWRDAGRGCARKVAVNTGDSAGKWTAHLMRACTGVCTWHSPRPHLDIISLSHSHRSHLSPQPMNGEHSSQVAHEFPSASLASPSSAPMHCTQRRPHSFAAGDSHTKPVGGRVRWIGRAAAAEAFAR